MTQRVGAKLHQEPLTTAERLALTRALTQQFERYLKPGERFHLAFELADDTLDLVLSLADPAGEQRLDLELSLTAEHNEHIPADELLGADAPALLVALARELVHGFFSNDRHLRSIPNEWSQMLWQGRAIWFRLRLWSPRLEAMADALLAAHPEPDDADELDDAEA
jgi:hypothetical protein